MNPTAKHMDIKISGGNGDVLAITPALRALKLEQPGRRISLHFIADRHLKLLSNNPNIDEYVLLTKEYAMPNWVQKRRTLHRILLLTKQRLEQKMASVLGKTSPKLIDISVGALGTYILHRKKMAEILAEALEVELQDDKLEIFLSEREIETGKARAEKYTNPVAINPTARSRPSHIWPIQRWNELVAQFPEIDFIQIGLPDEPLIEGVIDAREYSDNSLRESVALLKHVRCYIGMDTFWQHAAAAIDTPGVVLHCDGHPAVFGHDLHINIFKNLPCAPCLARLGYSTCPYDVECATSISILEVSQALQKQLANTASAEFQE